MTNIIFLDVDGVLHSAIRGTALLGDAQINVLYDIYSQVSPRPKIVLTSSWRDFPDAVIVLQKKLAKRGLTINYKTDKWTSKNGLYSRQEEIAMWIAKNKPKHYIIIDDKDLSYPSCSGDLWGSGAFSDCPKHCLRTNYVTGLTMNDAKKAALIWRL